MRRGTYYGPLAVLALGLLCGCAKPDDPWPRAEASGRVLLDGQPLKAGQITFFPVGGTKGPAAGTAIVDGQFQLDLHEGPVVGTNRVEIRSVQKTGRMVPTPMAVEGDTVIREGELVEEYADVVPTRYNTYSELKAEVRAETSNELRFEMTSQHRAAVQPAARGGRRE